MKRRIGWWRLLVMMAPCGWIYAGQGDYNAMDANGVRVFSPVPEVGVHPRVIMSPEDLAPWREQVGQTYRGRAFFSTRHASRRIDTLAGLNPLLSEPELLDAYPDVGPSGNHDLLYATLDVIYHEDAERAQVVCRAVANFARVVLARSTHHPKWGSITENIGGIPGNSGIRTGLHELWMRGGADFALAYDYLFTYMTEAQRSVCRRALSAATRDLVCWGMDFPRGRGVSNWYGYHGELGPMLLAIEGEEGFHEGRWESVRRMIRDWAEVHIYENGGSNEDGYTLNTSLREGQFTLIAMARRGENHYTRPNIREYFKWVVLSLVPGEESGDTVGYSSSRVSPYESAPVVARWAMPGDPVVNYYLWRYKGADYGRQNRWQYASWSTLLCMNWEDSEAMPLDMGKLGLPRTAVFPYQGLFITRSDWSDDASYLNLLARHDAWYDRHENVDRGRFVFAALGRRWAVDRPWGNALTSRDHSLVHIDGKAQAEASVGRGKAPNARLVAHGDREDGGMSYAVMDLSPAYNWLWSHSWESPGEGWEPETRSLVDLGWPWTREGQPARLHGGDDPQAPAFNFEGCNLWRKPNQPVEFCWRSAVLVRGKHPYTMIVDDVKKDHDEHVYDWYMPIPDDVEFIPWGAGQALLVEKNEVLSNGHPPMGSRRLLISPLGPGQPEIRMEEYVARVSRGKAHRARRLVISRSGTEGRFRVVLYPFRTTLETTGPTWREDWKALPLGAVVPQISPASATGFSLRVDGRKDAWTFTPGDDGRSRMHLQRGGQRLEIDG